MNEPARHGRRRRRRALCSSSKGDGRRCRSKRRRPGVTRSAESPESSPVRSLSSMRRVRWVARCFAFGGRTEGDTGEESGTPYAMVRLEVVNVLAEKERPEVFAEELDDIERVAQPRSVLGESIIPRQLKGKDRRQAGQHLDFEHPCLPRGTLFLTLARARSTVLGGAPYLSTSPWPTRYPWFSRRNRTPSAISAVSSAAAAGVSLLRPPPVSSAACSRWAASMRFASGTSSMRRKSRQEALRKDEAGSEALRGSDA